MRKQFINDHWFSKGNWKTEERKSEVNEECTKLFVVCDSHDICECSYLDQNGEEMEDDQWLGNGQLIASAPAMLDVLHCFCIESSGGIGEMKCHRYEKGRKTGKCKFATEDAGNDLPCPCAFWEIIQRAKREDWTDEENYFTEE